MSAIIIFGDERVEVEHCQTLESAVRSAGKLPDIHIYILNRKPIPMTSVVNDGDIIEAIKVASGG